MIAKGESSCVSSASYCVPITVMHGLGTDQSIIQIDLHSTPVRDGDRIMLRTIEPKTRPKMVARVLHVYYSSLSVVP